MNFHYKTPRGEQLIKELQQIDQELTIKRQLYQKTIQQQQQLESEFYEDKGQNKYLSIADDIMNELINHPNTSNHTNQLYPKISSHQQSQNNNIIPSKQNINSKVQPQKDKKYLPTNLNNPFIKNQDKIKLQRQQRQKQYRRMLQQQLQEQKKRKQQEKKIIKQQNYQFNSYIPQPINHKKKINPNSIQPPKIQPNPIDINFIKLKIQQIKHKYKKGRIDFQQYNDSIKKIKLFYNYQDEDDSKNIQNYQKKQNQQIENVTQLKNTSKQIAINNPSRTQSEPINNYSQQDYKTNNYNSQSDSSINLKKVKINNQEFQRMTKQLSQLQRQMMMKMFDDMREIYKTSLLNNQKLVQQALMTGLKMPYQTLPSNYNMQPIENLQSPSTFNNLQLKNKPQIAKQQNQIKQKSNELLSNKNDNSSEWIQKSLIGVTKKIPIKNKQSQLSNQYDINLFFSKTYKIARFKQFDYTENVNSSVSQISSITNTLQLKNGAAILKDNFEKDLKAFKKMQIDKQIQHMKDKLNIKQNNPKKQNINYKKQQKNINKNHQKVKHSKSTQQLQIQSNFKKQKSLQKGIQVQKNKISKEQQKIIQKPFLKKHPSHQFQQYKPKTSNIYNQSSKIGYPPFSPKKNQPQILEQQQYQTQSKQPPYKEQMNEVQGKQKIKVGKIIKTKNLINRQQSQLSIESLSKNQSSPYGFKPSFDNQYSISISPVQGQQVVYQSLQTVKSQIQSQNIQMSVENNSINNHLITVQSVEQSESKMLFRKPPLLKKPRSVSKKKQSIINCQNKYNNSSNFSCSQEYSSILSKPPQYKIGHQQLQNSNKQSQLQICQSAYQQTIRPNQSKKFTQMLKGLQKYKLPQIQEIKYQQKQHHQKNVNVINQNFNQKQNKQPSQTKQTLSNKWKSLQQARNLARQCRIKINQQKNSDNFGQKISELQSLMSCRKDESSILGYKKQAKEKQSQSKDQSNLPNKLDNGQDIYEDDFHSYQQQSQKKSDQL